MHYTAATWPHRPSDPQHANQILASVFLHLLFSSSQDSSVWLFGSEASYLSCVWSNITFSEKSFLTLSEEISHPLTITIPYYFTLDNLPQSKDVLCVCLYIIYLYTVCLSSVKCYLHESRDLCNAISPAPRTDFVTMRYHIENFSH